MNEIGMYYRNYFIQHTHNRCTDQPEQHNILQRLFLKLPAANYAVQLQADPQHPERCCEKVICPCLTTGCVSDSIILSKQHLTHYFCAVYHMGNVDLFSPERK